jgi:hypothetical protein
MDTTAGSPGKGAWRVAFRRALVVFLAVRVMASAVAFLAHTTVPAQRIVPAGGYSKPAYPAAAELLLGVWERSDALWYLHLAREGYGGHPQGAAFFPLYPLLVRLLAALGLPWLLAALLVSNAAFLGALGLLFRLAEHELGPEAAERAVWYQALYPGALFMLAPYAEALFLLLATGSLLAARLGRWALAGGLGALLAATRPVGIAIVAPLAAELGGQRAWRRGGALLLPLLGLGGVALLHQVTRGDPLAFARIQGAWQRQEVTIPLTLWRGFEQAWQMAASPTGGLYVMEAGAVLLALWAGYKALRHLPLCYGLFLWAGLLVPLAVPYPGRYFMSMLRFSAVLFPIFLVLAQQVRSREADMALRVVLAGLYGLCLALYVASQSMF